MRIAFCLMLAAPARADAGNLLLELWLNGRNLDKVVTVKVEGPHIFLTAADFKALALSLSVPAAAQYDIAALPGVTAHIDEAEQRLQISVPVRALPAQNFDAAAAPPPPTPASGSGAILHYDVSGTADDARLFGRGVSAGADLGLDIFTPNALATVTGFATAGDDGRHAARLDSQLAFDNPGALTHLDFGDAITIAPAFARAVRFGGVEYASDFGLRPDLDTRPLPQFFGQSAVPATVDVFSGAAKLFEQDVQPGPFTLNNLPIVSGGGTATVVTRDVLGRETTQTLSLYTDSDLLAPGLKSYAFDAGFLRTFYGETSFGYDQPMLSASWRQGLNSVTLESHGEAAPGQGLVGGGAALALGGFGAVGGDMAVSGGPQGSGTLFSLTAHALDGPFTFFGSAESASTSYRDLAELGGAPMARLRVELGLTTDIKPAGTLGLNWIVSKYAQQPASDFLTASWSVNLPGGLYFAASGLRDMESGALSAQVSLAMALGPHGLVSISAQEEAGQPSGLALYSDPADPDGGFGYRLLTGWQDGGRFEGDATYIGPHLAADASLAEQNATPALRVDLNGALIVMRGSIFTSHDPGQAVALVETGDPDVRVYRENRLAAVSDSHGEALLTGLDPYVANHIAIEPRDYAFDTLVEKTDALVVPRRLSGAVADFAPLAQHPLLARVVQGDGRAVPVGAAMMLDGQKEPLTVGHDGEVFIADLAHPVGAEIDLGGGAHCRVYIRPDMGHGALPHTAPLLCLREAASAY